MYYEDFQIQAGIFPLGKRLLNVRSIPHPAAHCRFRAPADFR